jgi:hypothetical protein
VAVATRYRASSSITDRLAAESSRRPALAPAVGGGGRASAARQAETPARREDGRESRTPDPDADADANAGLAATGATARKDWSGFMADATRDRQGGLGWKRQPRAPTKERDEAEAAPPSCDARCGREEGLQKEGDGARVRVGCSIIY